MSTCVFLIFDLLQDVNILWPIAQLVAKETPYRLGFLISDKFVERDTQGRWAKELQQLASSTHAESFRVANELEAYEVLAGKGGIIFAGAESNLGAHATSHRIFQSAPPSFVKATLQHGYECVGFLQNREQSMVHGEQVRFAADVLCAWMPLEKLRHLHPSERSKLLVTGPSALLQDGASNAGLRPSRNQPGLVCENLHSVRLNAAGDFKSEYMDTFSAFAKAMGKRRQTIALRPHPGGQYVIRNAVKLPSNMVLQNEPMYRVDLSQYAYGISAPSSVLIDMVFAGIPTAVWQDESGVIDTGSYSGLNRISSLADWIGFAESAVRDRDAIVSKQREFLEQTGILTDSREVRRRFLNLINGACALRQATSAALAPRILFVANAEIPTLQLGFMKPLKRLRDAHAIEERLITESDLRRQMGKKGDEPRAVAWLNDQIQAYRPDIAVFCRYSGPCIDQMIEKLRLHDVPIVFHIDDDLLHVPREIGEAKFKEHNRPERLATVDKLLRKSDLVYCSTELLKARFMELGYSGNLHHGRIYCSGEVLNPVELRPTTTVGYMGFDHAHDLELVLPELVEFLRDRQDITFELFGSIPKPKELDEFGDRVVVIPPVRPYSAFLEHFASRRWDIGICPLATTQFNRVKANTKWVEYTMVGAAVIATSGMAYDDCCANECGVLVDAPGQWLDVLKELSSDPARRYKLVANAQQRLREEYSLEMLRGQVLAKFDLARQLGKSTEKVKQAA